MARTQVNGVPARSVGGWVLLLVLVVYGVVAFGLYEAALGNLSLLPLSVFLLPGLLTGLVLVGAFTQEADLRRLALGAAILPLLTLVQLTLVGALPSLTQTTISYLILGMALVVYRQAMGTPEAREQIRPRDLVRGLRVGLPLGVGIALAQLLTFALPPTFAVGEASVAVAVLVAATVAFIDEYWFRGVLQPQASAVSRPVVGWLAAVGLFVAFAAPTGDLPTLAFRAWFGLILGFFAWRGRLALSLMTRTVAAVAFVLAGFLGFPLVG